MPTKEGMIDFELKRFSEEGWNGVLQNATDKCYNNVEKRVQNMKAKREKKGNILFLLLCYNCSL